MPLTVPEMQIVKSDPRRERVSVEYWGTNLQEGDIGRVSPTGAGVVYGNNIYMAMWVTRDSYNLFYSVWCTNDHELYDMIVGNPCSFVPFREPPIADIRRRTTTTRWEISSVTPRASFWAMTSRELFPDWTLSC